MAIRDTRAQQLFPLRFWLLAPGMAAIIAGLLWLLLTFPSQPCERCGASPTPALRLTPGVVATMNSAIFAYSPGWQVSEAGADPAEPDDPFTEPAGVITFTYTGDALWLLLAPGDYWAYLYATVDGQPANRLANIAGNVDSAGAAAGYTTLFVTNTIAVSHTWGITNVSPVSATVIANTQARMRPVSPMLTQSETAPMVQKLVLLATAPMMIAITNTASST
jgi:hypothetical protein